jgi:hypothetical protein
MAQNITLEDLYTLKYILWCHASNNPQTSDICVRMANDEDYKILVGMRIRSLLCDKLNELNPAFRQNNKILFRSPEHLLLELYNSVTSEQKDSFMADLHLNFITYLINASSEEDDIVI